MKPITKPLKRTLMTHEKMRLCLWDEKGRKAAIQVQKGRSQIRSVEIVRRKVIPRTIALHRGVEKRVKHQIGGKRDLERAKSQNQRANHHRQMSRRTRSQMQKRITLF